MKKFLISIIVMFLLLFSYTTYASSYKFSTDPAFKNVTPGEEVYITLKISDIDAGEEGINVVETTLTYDKDVIESIDFISKNNWKSTYNPTVGNYYGKLLYTKMVLGVTEDEEIGVLKVKIKKDAQPFETEIKLLDVTSNDGYTLMNDGTKIITLRYVPEEKPSNNTTPENTTEVDYSGKPSNSTVPETIENNTPINTKPVEQNNPISNIINNAQTGDVISIIIIILFLAVLSSVILLIISIKMKKDNNK